MDGNRKIKNGEKVFETVWDQYIQEPPQTQENRSETGLTVTPNGFIPSKTEEIEPDDDLQIPTMKKSLGIGLEREDGFIDPVLLKTEEVISQIKSLHHEFQAKIKYDTHKEKIIDQLHQELQQYKDEIVKKPLQMLLIDLIQFIDSLKKMVEHLSGQPETERNPKRLFKLLEEVPTDVEDIFSRQGVFSYTCQDDVFDPIRQRALKRVETPDPLKDKKVAERIRSGYDWDGKIIRPEIVSVFVYRAPEIDPVKAALMETVSAKTPEASARAETASVKPASAATVPVEVASVETAPTASVLAETVSIETAPAAPAPAEGASAVTDLEGSASVEKVLVETAMKVVTEMRKTDEQEN